MPPHTTSEQRVMVECDVCHIRYDVSARTFRDIRAARVRPRCVIHRRRRRPETVTAEMRRFWLDRFTLDEIVVMGTAITSYLRPSARQALVAAADDEQRA